MYNSSYSKANFGLAAKKMHKSKSKSCGYYMKIVFFFSSLIQSLIIASLVLFLVYGQPEHTVEEKRLQELDKSVSTLTMENYVLREKEKNLTKHLNITLTAKLTNDKFVFELRKLANTSSATIRSMQMKMTQCEMEKRIPPAPRSFAPAFCPDQNENNRQLRLLLQQSEEMLKLVKANFTQKMNYMRIELENSNKDKDRFHLEVIEIRRDKAYLQNELELYKKKCKEDFVASLQGIPNVTKEFLKRIDDLFLKHISFQLTCDKQKNQLENIRENCSSLSREVENKLQSYLDIVGNEFTKINGENSKYVTENKRLTEDADWCNQNRSAMIRENRRTLEQIQLKHDQDTERLLLENQKVKGDNRLKEDLLSVKEKEIKMLTLNVEALNTSLASCKFFVGLCGSMKNLYHLDSLPAAQNVLCSENIDYKKPAQRNLFVSNPFSMPNGGGTSLNSAGLSKPNVGWPNSGSTGPGFPSQYGAGSSSRYGSLGSGATGSFGTSQGGPGSSRMGVAQTGTNDLGGLGTGLTGIGSLGPSLTAAGNIGAGGTGSTAYSSSGSSGVGVSKPGVAGVGVSSVGSNIPAVGGTGVGRTSGIDSQLLNQAQISYHLKELQRYSIPRD